MVNSELRFGSMNAPTPIVRAYSYIRMSTEQQLKGDSLRRQLEMSRAYAERHNLLLDDTLRDLGVSAWKGINKKKGALGEFFRLVQAGQIPRGSYLLVESLDRLSRDEVIEALGVFLDIIKAGITIVTLADEQSYSQESIKGDWTRLIISLAVMARAHEESERKSQRVREAAEAKRQRALLGHGKFSQNVPSWISQERNERGEIVYALNEHADTVRRIYEMAADGMGQLSITRVLNSEDTPPLRHGRGWHQGVVGLILDNPAVTGTYQPVRMSNGKRVPYSDPVVGYFPSVVSPELYARAQQVRKAPPSKGAKGKRFSNLFQGMLFCTHCGSRMWIKYGSSGSNPQKYLQCYDYFRNRGPKRCVGKRHFNYDVFEAAVLDHIHEFNLADIFNRGDTDEQIEQLHIQLNTATINIESLKARESQLVSQLELANENALPTLMNALNQRAVERKALEDRIEDIKQQLLILETERNTQRNAGAEIARERASWATATEAEIFRSRSRVHQAIKEFIDFISFNSDTRTATVIIGGGLRAYEFHKDQIVNRFDATEAFINDRPGSMQPHHFLSDLKSEDHVGRSKRLRVVSKLIDAA